MLFLFVIPFVRVMSLFSTFSFYRNFCGYRLACLSNIILSFSCRIWLISYYLIYSFKTFLLPHLTFGLVFVSVAHLSSLFIFFSYIKYFLFKFFLYLFEGFYISLFLLFVLLCILLHTFNLCNGSFYKYLLFFPQDIFYYYEY